MPKVKVPMMYHIEQYPEANWQYGGKPASKGAYSLSIVGGEHDGEVIAAGPIMHAGGLLGLLRLAAFAHTMLENDQQALNEVLLGYGPVGSKAVADYLDEQKGHNVDH